MEFKAILFDLDGVLALSEPAHFEAWKGVVKNFDKENPVINDREVVGITDLKVAGMIKSRLGLTKSEESLCEMKISIYLELVKKGLPSVAGRDEFLEKYKDQCQMAVVSSSTRAEIAAVIESQGLNDYFSFFIGYEDSVTHKPLPEPYQKAINRFGLRPGETLAIEDSPAGLNSAKSANAYAVGLNTSGLLGNGLSSPVFDDFHDIMQWLENDFR